MPKTVCQSVAWFKRYKTLKSVTVGSLNLRKFSYSARTRSAFGLARKKGFSECRVMVKRDRHVKNDTQQLTHSN